MATTLPKVEQLSARVFRILGCNPGAYRLQGTNSYLVGTGKRRVLIDTSDPGVPEYTHNLSQVLKEHSAGLQEIVITHWHLDHVGAVEEVCRDIAHDSIKVSKIKRKRQPDIEIGSAKYDFIEDGAVVKTEGASLRVIHTPGHAEDHACLWLEEENSIFSGDCVLGEGTGVFEDLYDYMKSLETIRSLKPSRIYPGHGPVVLNGVEKVTEYITHRQLREDQISAVLKENTNQWLTAMDLVKIIYTETPEILHHAAAGNVLLHLGKLAREGKVEHKGDISAIHEAFDNQKEERENILASIGEIKWRWIITSGL